MKHHSVLSDYAFEDALKYGTLDPALFDHEAHLRLAWIQLEKYGIDTAIANICIQLKNYVKCLGAEDKYNTTVTIAAIRAVNHFKLKSEADNFTDFIKEYPRLKNNFKSLLGQHYKTDIFKSESARKSYLEPELLPFD